MQCCAIIEKYPTKVHSFWATQGKILQNVINRFWQMALKHTSSSKSSGINRTKPNPQIFALLWSISRPHKLGLTYCLMR